MPGLEKLGNRASLVEAELAKMASHANNFN